MKLRTPCFQGTVSHTPLVSTHAGMMTQSLPTLETLQNMKISCTIHTSGTSPKREAPLFSDAIARPGKALNIHQWWCQWHPADSDPRLKWMCALGEMVLLRKVIYSIPEHKSVCIHKYVILYTLIRYKNIFIFILYQI